MSVRDWTFIVGLVTMAIGVELLWGTGASLLVVGSILVLIAVAAQVLALAAGARGKDDDAK